MNYISYVLLSIYCAILSSEFYAIDKINHCSSRKMMQMNLFKQIGFIASTIPKVAISFQVVFSYRKWILKVYVCFIAHGHTRPGY